jgi:hypothetical protein
VNPRDISAELRERHATLAQCPGPMGQECIRCAAASEIERLQEQVSRLNLLVMAAESRRFEYVWRS